MRLVFATNNQYKLEEVQEAVASNFEILSLREVAGDVDIEETGTLLEENAKIKAMYVVDNHQMNCFADDTGLEIEALNGAPGVYSARYAGEDCSFDDNMNKVLEEMKGVDNRGATFKTVIHLVIDGNEHVFKGEVKGSITREKQGEKGFGYDPIFKPEGYDKTFAELSLDEKNRISHRGIATRKLIAFLNDYKQ